MGLFDYVEVLCPSCGGIVEFQSKGAAFPRQEKHVFEDITEPMRADLIGKREACYSCGATVEIKGEVTVKAWPEATG